MALTPPLQPMLAASHTTLPREQDLPGGLAYEQKADGYRAIVFTRPGGVFIQSRNGADLTGAFPDIAQAATTIGTPLVLDGELVVPRAGRLDFTELQARARRRGRLAQAAAAAWPAYLITFDVLETAGIPLLDRPYRQRREVLEQLFTDEVLVAPFTLCPATVDRDLAREWMAPEWGAAGIEGVVVKGLSQPYRPGRRDWIKVRARTTTEGIIAGITGPASAPTTLLLARYSPDRRLRMIARTTLLRAPARRELATRIRPADPDHPWIGRRFSAGWGSHEDLTYTPVRPELVAEVSADTAIDAGVYRHPVRFLRVRDDITTGQVPLVGQ